MILPFLFIISSSFLGFAIISLINVAQSLLISQILAGWCLGSMAISSIAFITTYFFPLTFLHSLVLLISMLIVSILIMLIQYQRTKKLFGATTIRLEKSVTFYLALIIIGTTIIFYTNYSYHQFPRIIPSYGRSIFEMENSFISSILNGVNYRRKNFFKFSDPNLLNETYKVSSLPQIYSACLISLGCSYADVTVLVAFFGSLSTTAAIFLLSIFYSPESSILIVLVYFFNGGSSIFNYFKGPKDKIPSFITKNLTLNLYPNFSPNVSDPVLINTLDGVHNCGRGETPHYSILGIHLAYSKTSAFSLPLSIFSIAFLVRNQQPGAREGINHVLSGLLASFIPSLSSSVAFFAIASCYAPSFLKVMPFALSIVPKIYNSFYTIYPLWREYQMNGIFFAQIATFIDALGIPYAFVFLVPLLFFDFVYFHRCLSVIAGFLLLCFVREGNDAFANGIAISGLFVPFVAGNFVYIMNKAKAKIFGKAYLDSTDSNDDSKGESNENKTDSNNEFNNNNNYSNNESNDNKNDSNNEFNNNNNYSNNEFNNNNNYINNESNDNENDLDNENKRKSNDDSKCGSNENKCESKSESADDSIEADKVRFNFSAQFLGIFNFFYYFLIAYIVVSGLLNLHIVSHKKHFGFSDFSYQAGQWLNYYAKPSDIVLTEAKGMNPVPIVSGRQILIGRPSDLWRRGEDTRYMAELFANISKAESIADFMKKENIFFFLQFKKSLLLNRLDNFKENFKVVAENEDWILFSRDKLRFQAYNYH